jgi:head-to-tail connecting protein
MPDETQRARINKIGAQLKNVRTSYDAHWRELGEHFAPRRTRFSVEDKNRGDKRHGKIINEHGMFAARTLRSGMFAGITSPARPWRRLTTPDPDLAEFGRVKDWLAHVNKNMQTLDLRSNLYNALPIVFGELGVFGMAAMAIMDDADDGFRCYNFPIGSYWVAVNQRGVVDTFWREFSTSVRNLVALFGTVTASGQPDWSKFSQQVKNYFDKGEYEQQITVTHFLYPNMEYDPTRLESKFKKFSSCYFESAGSVVGGSNGYAAGTGETFLRESGFDRFPVLVPRWEVTEGDAYATSCPGMDALGTTKEIQFLEKKVSRAIEKQLNPALKGPPSLRNQKVSLIAGDITLVDERDGKNGLTPIHEVNININDVTNDIARKEVRVNRAFYVDMFLMLDQMEGIQPRNEKEIAERHEEKLLQLGPVLESVNDDLLEPMTDIEFDRQQFLGMVPEPPDEIAGKLLKVQYESVMAKAQKLVGVAGTERFFSFLGNMAAAFPVVLKKVKPWAAVDEYSDMMGVSSAIIATDDEAQALVDHEADAQRQQQMAAAIPELAKSAQLLSASDLSTDNALSRVLAGA